MNSLSKLGKMVYCLLIFLLPTLLFSRDIAPFPTKNLNPLTRVTGLPWNQTSTIQSSGTFSLQFTYEKGNSCSWDTTGTREKIYIDGESVWSTLRIRYGTGGGIEVGLVAPYVIHHAGFTDHFITWWHHITGFPQGRRKSVHENMFRYAFIAENTGKINLEHRVSGIGSVQIFIGKQFFKDEINRLDLFLTCGLPTRRSPELIGSDTPSLSVQVSGARKMLSARDVPTIFGNLGCSIPGSVKYLKGIQRQYVIVGTIGADWQISRYMILKAQFDFNSPLYVSTLDQAGIWAGQSVLGAQFIFGHGFTCSLGITEDSIVSSSADAGFLFSMNKTMSIVQEGQ